jgi:NAD(P)-dependent dehydrogenase (short-subunit alcohol dehydrogenase family)
MKRLEGKVTLITGTGGGQGRAAALRFASEGALVVGCDIQADANAQTTKMVEADGGTMTGMDGVDLGDPEQARQWVEDAAALHGRIDVVYNNASACKFAPIAEMSIEDWHFTIRNELDLIFYVTKYAWNYLAERGGVIINTGSCSGVVGSHTSPAAAHAATKGGVIAMTRQLAVEGAAHGIRVVSISPGPIASPGTEEIFKDPQVMAVMMPSLLIQRPGRPEEIAATAAFLASDDGSFITGANIAVDGGWTAF